MDDDEDGQKLESFPTDDIIHPRSRGCSSVVERHVANVNVVGSSPITRFYFAPAIVIHGGVAF